MASGHGSAHNSNEHIIDEKSIQDKALAALAVLVLVGLLVLGCYWESMPLPTVQIDEVSQKK